MNCDAYRDLMMMHFDGNINDVDFARLKQHMNACASCKSEFMQLESILNSLEEGEIVEPPSDFESQVMTRIKTLEQNKNRNIEALIYGIPILIIISLPAILLFRFSGSRILDMAINAFEYLLPYPGASDVINNIIALLSILASRMEKTMIQLGMGFIKTNQDIIIGLIAVLFVVEWMFVALVKRSWRRAAE